MSATNHIAFLLVLTVGLDANAQRICPFDSSSVVPDTLEPAGYFPLSVGNDWHYIVRDGSFFEIIYTETVVGDTLISGATFYEIQHVSYDDVTGYSAPITHSDTTTYYLQITDSSKVRIVEENWWHQVLRLGAAFQSCYDAYGSVTEVRGGYNRQFTISENGPDTTYAVNSIKEFTTIEGEETYAYSIGLVRIEGDPFVETDLVYARVGNAKYGTSLESLFSIRVGFEQHLLPLKSELTIHPTPAHNRAIVQLSIAEPTRVSLVIVDAIGREVAHVHTGLQSNYREEYSLVVSHLPAGLYFVIARKRGRSIAKALVVLK